MVRQTRVYLVAEVRHFNIFSAGIPIAQAEILATKLHLILTKHV